MKSVYIKTGAKAEFPPFRGGNLLYMFKTSIEKPELPSCFSDYLRSICQTLEHVKSTVDTCYITIHEKTVCMDTHRRGGIHVDYNWYEGGWDVDTTGRWKPKVGMHGGAPPGHRYVGSHADLPKHIGDGAKVETHGGMLLVSNYPGCKVYRGDFEGEILDGGDCKLIDLKGLESEVMESGEVYYLNALGIHEPLIIKEKVDRSLIRINFHPEARIAV